MPLQGERPVGLRQQFYICAGGGKSEIIDLSVSSVKLILSEESLSNFTPNVSHWLLGKFFIWKCNWEIFINFFYCFLKFPRI